MAALAGAWAREVAADAWPGPVNEGAPRATRLFVAGGATHAGKSTVCLGVLQAALEKYGASKVAYVKAATQDEREDTVSRFCAANKIEYRSGKQCPIVYYAGFTRAFLDGSAEKACEDLDPDKIEYVGAEAEVYAKLQEAGFKFSAPPGPWSTVLGFGITRDWHARTVRITARKHIDALVKEHLSDEANCACSAGETECPTLRSALKGGPDIIGGSKNRLIAIRLQHLKLNIYHFC